MFVSVVGFFILFLLAWFFSDGAPTKPVLQGTVKPSSEVPWRRFHAALLAAVLLLGGTGVWLQANEPRPVQLAKPLAGLPAVLGDWTLVQAPVEPGFILEGADESIDRVYRDQSGSLVRLQIGYYAFQQQGKEMVSYRLDDLYRKARVVEIGKDRTRFAVNLADLQSPRNRRIALFWNHVGGRDTAGGFAAKAIAARSWLFEERNNGAVVIVSSELPVGADDRITIQKLTDFALLTWDTAVLD
jgi:EpsI family protein